MVDVAPITDDAAYERAEARLVSTMNTPLGTPEEEAELDALAEEVRRYYKERFGIWKVPTDGVDEVVGGLDDGYLTLEDALDAFGGLERFVEYMTRPGELDGATLEVLVGEFGLDRAELEKAHCEGAGWDAISAEGQEACGDLECCPAGEGNWRVELAGMVGAGEREGLRGREVAGVN